MKVRNIKKYGKRLNGDGGKEKASKIEKEKIMILEASRTAKMQPFS